MLNKFQEKAQKLIALAESIAFDLGQSNVGSEHLLLAFLKTKDNKLRNFLEKDWSFESEFKSKIHSGDSKCGNSQILQGSRLFCEF